MGYSISTATPRACPWVLVRIVSFLYRPLSVLFAFTSIYMDFRDDNEDESSSYSWFVSKVPKIATWVLRRNVKVPHSFVNGYIHVCFVNGLVVADW